MKTWTNLSHLCSSSKLTQVLWLFRSTSPTHRQFLSIWEILTDSKLHSLNLASSLIERQAEDCLSKIPCSKRKLFRNTRQPNSKNLKRLPKQFQLLRSCTRCSRSCVFSPCKKRSFQCGIWSWRCSSWPISLSGQSSTQLSYDSYSLNYVWSH